MEWTNRAALGCVLLFAAAATVRAADKDLLDTLLENGVITDEQHVELEGERGPAAERGSAAVSVGEGGLEVVSADGDFSIGIGARLHADWARHRGETGVTDGIDGTTLRRARIELGGELDTDWRWAAEVDFANDEVAIKDFWLGFRGWPGVAVAAGQQKQPYSLALEMSSNDIPFMERSIDNALVVPFVDRAIGVRADASGERWFAAAGAFGEPVEASSADEGWGASGRFVFAPVIEDDRVIHLGLRTAYREPSSAGSIRIRDETTSFSDLHIVDTGELGDVDAVTLFGPEAAVAIGAFSLVGEYNRAAVSRRLETDLDLDSWHLAATWTLGGESRAAAYDIRAGEFKRLAAARNFSRAGGGGTWELAARYASLDLNDAAFVGGRERAVTLAANWYANANVRLMLDWTRVVDTDGSNPVRVEADGLDVFGLRAQYAF